MPDYSPIDQSTALQYIFYPRKDSTLCPENAFDLFLSVAEDVFVHGRLHEGHRDWPWILFFHGNGEVTSDYDGIAPLYHRKRLNLAVVDYRGYGDSDGVPTLNDLIDDAHSILQGVQEELVKKGLKKDLWVMGRSLGSMSALELAYGAPEGIRGLIIESGFTSVVRILRPLKIPFHGIPLERIDQEGVDRVNQIAVPTLLLHGESDTLVPLKEAEHLYQCLGSQDKELVVIPEADHNDILYVGFQTYFEAIGRFIDRTRRLRSSDGH